jgi:bifunctional DNA-binding transcriptional regulator/antitoxin component of YhaV-PrlF toxin-antitoxin module
MELSNDFQLVLPEPIIEALGLKTGDFIAFENQDGVVQLRKFQDGGHNQRLPEHFQRLNLEKAWVAFKAPEEKFELQKYSGKTEDAEDWEDDENVH